MITINEPLTYQRGARRSYFADMHAAQFNSDRGATERLERHALEARVELAARARRATNTDARFEQRRTASDGGSFTPPLWLIDEFATAPRPGRALSTLIGSDLLPDGVASVNVPRVTTGTTTAVTDDGDTVTMQDLEDDGVSSPATTVAGRADVALPLLEQAPSSATDRVIFADMAADYDAQLERLLLVGSGRGSEFTGILNITGVNTVAYTDDAPTASALYAALPGAAAAIGNNRKAPPEAWLTRTARWAWLAGGTTRSGDLLFPPVTAPPVATRNSLAPVSNMLGWPLYTDDAIPADLGDDEDEDVIVGCRPSDLLLFEGSDRVIIDRESLSGTLGARLTLRASCAFIVRQPASIAVVGGTGTTVPTGF